MKTYYETFAKSVADNVKEIDDVSEDRIGKVWNQGGRYQGKIIREVDHESEVLSYLTDVLFQTIDIREDLGEDYSSTQMIKNTKKNTDPKFLFVGSLISFINLLLFNLLKKIETQ